MNPTSNARRCAALLCAALSLTSCAKPLAIVEPEVEEVPVFYRDRIPPELLAPVYKPYLPARQLFADDLERALREALAQIDRANADKAALRELESKAAREATQRGEADPR